MFQLNKTRKYRGCLNEKGFEMSFLNNRVSRFSGKDLFRVSRICSNPTFLEVWSYFLNSACATYWQRKRQIEWQLYSLLWVFSGNWNWLWKYRGKKSDARTESKGTKSKYRSWSNGNWKKSVYTAFITASKRGKSHAQSRTNCCGS